MSFLDQLKKQADALSERRTVDEVRLEELAEQTEAACRIVRTYFQDLARQLAVIEPSGPALTLDGKTPWPALRLVDFRADARRKRLRDREVFDNIAIGWRIVPKPGEAATGVVSVNFPTDMQRVESRLAMGWVKHQRHEIRDLDKNVLRELRYEFEAETRGSVVATAQHDLGLLQFRLVNTAGLEVVQADLPAARVDVKLMDELAKRIVGEPNVFP